MDIAPFRDTVGDDYDLENDDGGLISRLFYYFKFLFKFLIIFLSLIICVYFSLKHYNLCLFFDKNFDYKAIGDHPLPH